MSNQFQVALLILQFAILLSPSARAQDQKQAQRSVPQLIERLGSARFREREAAQKELLSRDEAYPDLRRALPMLNAEGRRRANAILDVMTRRLTKRFLQYGREGRVDLFVEWSGSAGKKIDSKEFWDCVIEIGLKQLKRTASQRAIREWEEYFRAKNYGEFLKERPPFVSDDDTIETAELTTHLTLRECSGRKNPKLGLGCSLVVTTSPLELDCASFSCIVLTTGKLKLRDGINMIVISDESFPTNFLFNSVVVTREGGSREPNLNEGIRESDLLLRSGTGFQLSPENDPHHLHLSPGPHADGPSRARTKAIKADSDGPVFFKIQDLGIEFTKPEAWLQVKAVDPKSPFSKAGIQPGDFIRAIDGVDADDVECARRQLRHAFVLGGAELKISRQGKPMTLNVNFFGWELPHG